MSIEDGQKKFAAKRKQRQCHNSCPLISIRVIYYLIQLVFIAFGLFAIVVSAMTFDKFKAGSIVEMDGVDIQEFFPIRLSIQYK